MTPFIFKNISLRRAFNSSRMFLYTAAHTLISAPTKNDARLWQRMMSLRTAGVGEKKDTLWPSCRVE